MRLRPFEPDVAADFGVVALDRDRPLVEVDVFPA
jgi:hypothetical protein